MQQNLVDSSKPHEIQTVVIEINEGGVDFSEIGRNNKVRLLNEINRYPFNQFELNVNNKLACVEGCINSNGSIRFGQDLLEACENNTVCIKVLFVRNVGSNVDQKEVLMGGMTVKESDTMYLILINPETAYYETERGDVVLADAGMVFIHELSGHCLPMIRNVQANAVEIENVIRSEIKFGVPLRKGNPHDSSI